MKKMLFIILLAIAVTCIITGRLSWAIDTPSTAQLLPSVKVNQKDNADMVLIPAGKFLMGTSYQQLTTILKANPSLKRELFANEVPQRKVDIDAFYIYKNEVTVAQYRVFCEKTNRKMPTEPPWKWQDNHPMVNVSWKDACAYAEWAGVLLPTEAQWEKAARGTDGNTYPWGPTWDCAKCSNPMGTSAPIKGTSPVGSFPAGASPYGVMDMSGNAWEWCADWYGESYYKTAISKNPTGPATGSFRVLRGGSWRSDNSRYLRTVDRGFAGPVLKISYIGFRCAVPAGK